jgi:hypothetical protein
VDSRTTDKDLQWLLDDDALPVAQGIPAAIPERGQTSSKESLEPSEEPTEPAYAESSGQPTEGDFIEEIEGEVVDAPKPRGIPIKWLIPIGAGALLIALTVMVVVLPVIQASATVIITPDRQSLEVSTTLSIQARKLFIRSLTLSQTVKTTGSAHQNASVATGYLTFYNALPSPQTIPAGTLITGADGVNVITEQDAYIPAGALSVNGQVTVLAHTTTTGAAANISAGDINGACCRDYVFARNSQFSGGRAARDYRTATKTDIQTVTQDLNRITTAAFANQARGQLQSTEASLPPQCTGKTESSQNPGAEAAQITVTLTSTCSAYAYSQAELNAKEAAVFSQAITAQLGSGYALAGQLAQKITGVQMETAHVQITESLAGVCSYHFSRAELLAMQNLIASKSQTQATILLLHTRGVKTAGVQIAHDGQTMPRDPGAISIVVFNR